ncbi:MAG: zinc-dependent metalloprotease [Bdellovibrionaceae bacterium]|nr:zinc-dependent metalloprotease [Pseudobdellovibrionaceae bacterium]
MSLWTKCASTALVAVSMGLVACHNSQTSGFRIDPAPAAIDASFDVTTSGRAGATRPGGFVIGLKKSSLEKYFLLIPQLRSGGAAGHVSLFEPQVVYFKLAGAQVGLFELNVARIYEDITTDNLVQTFPVAYETADYVYFDWNYGLSAIVARSPYAGAMPGARRLFTEGTDQLLDVVQSFIDAAEFKNNVLRVRQVSRVREAVLRFRKDPSQLTPEDGGEVGISEMRDSTMTMDLVLRPYDVAKKNIEPRWSKISKGFGYFTRLMGQAGSAAPREAILRWDTSPERGPIRVRISQNVPAHLIPAVREGIEYWNRVLGRDILKVETGVSPQTGLEERTVMVHWVDWRDAGFAYAGFQSDPLTGEIIQGQIFMTSSWMLSGQSYEDLKGSLSRRVDPRVHPHPAGAKPLASSCAYHADAGRIWTERAPGALTEQALPHVIRGVVAHEMGHVMGLRHNFAGSFYNGVDEAVHLEKTREFLKTGAIAALPTATSIMDYSNAIDDVMNGKFIQSGVLSYDESVVAWGYRGDESKKSLPFCTDDHMTPELKSIGCDVFDSARHPVAFGIVTDAWLRGRGLWRDFAQIVNALRPDAQTVVDLDDVLNAKEKLVANTPAIGDFVGTRALFSERQKTHDTKDLKNWEEPAAAEKAQKEAWETQAQEVGLVALFELALPFTTDANGVRALDQTYWSRQLKAMVATPKFQKGQNFNQIAYDLSSVETQRLEKFFEVKLGKNPFQTGFVVLTQAFPGPERLVPNPATGKPEKKVVKYQNFPKLKAQMPQVLDLSLALARAETGRKLVAVADGVRVEVPQRLFAPALFVEFAGLFDERYNPNAEAGLKATLLASLKTELNAVYAAWGIPDAAPLATAELRRLYTEKSVAAAPEAKAFVEGELARLEALEAAFAKAEPKAATSEE